MVLGFIRRAQLLRCFRLYHSHALLVPKDYPHHGAQQCLGHQPPLERRQTPMASLAANALVQPTDYRFYDCVLLGVIVRLRLHHLRCV